MIKLIIIAIAFYVTLYIVINSIIAIKIINKRMKEIEKELEELEL